MGFEAVTPDGGYRTPNIDRIAQEGTLFTGAYAQQGCMALVVRVNEDAGDSRAAKLL